MTQCMKDVDSAIIHKHFVVVKDDFSRAGSASSEMKKTLKALGIDSNIVRRIAVATYEAEINVVIHSLGGNIAMVVNSENISVYVEDLGPGIEDVQKAMTEGFSTASNAVREMGFGAGMGLPNMKRCSDFFSIDSHGGGATKIKMTWQIKEESGK